MENSKSFIWNCYQNEVMKYFVLGIISNMYSKDSLLPNLKFVFDDETIKYMQLEIKKSRNENGQIEVQMDANGKKKFFSVDVVNQAFHFIQEINYKYKKIKSGRLEISEDEYYLFIDDSNEFFSLLARLVYLANDKKFKISNILLGDIWVRMGENDFQNVNSFLKKQINFLENKDFFDKNRIDSWQKFGSFDDCDLCYLIDNNDFFCETNQKMIIALKNQNNLYVFPGVHFEIATDSLEPTCYIYAIQDDKNYRRDEYIENKLIPVKKGLRNKYVNFRMILSLKYFIDILEQFGVRKIRVPLLQILNYYFHLNVGKNVLDKIESGKESDNYLKMFERTVGKEDIISKNKTERLVDIFMVLLDYYGEIVHFENDIFTGDELIGVINSKNKTR